VRLQQVLECSRGKSQHGNHSFHFINVYTAETVVNFTQFSNYSVWTLKDIEKSLLRTKMYIPDSQWVCNSVLPCYLIKGMTRVDSLVLMLGKTENFRVLTGYLTMFM
jgi:hypothetical protein